MSILVIIYITFTFCVRLYKRIINRKWIPREGDFTWIENQNFKKILSQMYEVVDEYSLKTLFKKNKRGAKHLLSNVIFYTDPDMFNLSFEHMDLIINLGWDNWFLFFNKI